MNRKLVTIRTVREIIPIEGADKIELVVVDGWKCVSIKGEFKVGDPGLYFEVDSLLPIDDRFEFLRKSCFRKNDVQEGFRIKTIKLRGVTSQGLLLPVDKFPEVNNADVDNLTEALGVMLWTPPVPACLGGVAKGLFPSFVQGTDQERIQNLPQYFELMKDVRFEVTEKLDGASGTYYLNDDEFGVCSRGIDLCQTDTNTYWAIAVKYDIERTMRLAQSTYGLGNFAIQGEVFGEGIGGDAGRNPLKISGQRLCLFNIYDIEHRRYFDHEEDKIIFGKLLEKQQKGFCPFEWVPIIDYALVFDKFNTMEELIAYAAGYSMVNPDRKREGIVCKSATIHDRYGSHTCSFKIINNEYLLDDKS